MTHTGKELFGLKLRQQTPGGGGGGGTALKKRAAAPNYVERFCSASCFIIRKSFV
jgi:hypothetical protein